MTLTIRACVVEVSSAACAVIRGENHRVHTYMCICPVNQSVREGKIGNNCSGECIFFNRCSQL